MKKPLLLLTHLAAFGIGFALGVHALPILIAPPAPTAAEVGAQVGPPAFAGQFRRDLEDSDALHRGEGTVSVGARSIGLGGSESFGQFITAARYR